MGVPSLGCVMAETLFSKTIKLDNWGKVTMALRRQERLAYIERSPVPAPD